MPRHHEPVPCEIPCRCRHRRGPASWSRDGTSCARRSRATPPGACTRDHRTGPRDTRTPTVSPRRPPRDPSRWSRSTSRSRPAAGPGRPPRGPVAGQPPSVPACSYASLWLSSSPWPVLPLVSSSNPGDVACASCSNDVFDGISLPLIISYSYAQFTNLTQNNRGFR